MRLKILAHFFIIMFNVPINKFFYGTEYRIMRIMRSFVKCYINQYSLPQQQQLLAS